ncbi:hypothetical protein NDN13_01455 [Acinetobacter sp. C32I]|uniref:hypothetical protein n=1 Tax=Acinetobacter sp. C32I TaxID=2950074 RepID=UPI002036BE29|nr:hypothetical protein [Acinetobacter sp. C32I]USA53887.1 hypothetical protein NDN13_01455 [Acinetobacter sp. C32I]
MKNDLKIFLIDTVGWIVSVSVIVFFFTLWLFSFNDVENALKESWSITFSALAAFTTIGTAIIAAYLFNDWKDQHNHQARKEFIVGIKQDFNNYKNFVNDKTHRMHFLRFEYFNKQSLPTEHRNYMIEILQYNSSISKHILDLKLGVQNLDIISNNTELTVSKKINAKITEIEERIDQLYSCITMNLSNTNPSTFHQYISEYHNYISTESIARIYEVAICELLESIPAKS